MGSGMAGRLLGAGYPLTVYNRTPEKAQSLVERGAELAKSPADAASGKDVIFSMLADDQGCREVWLGKSGALARAAPGAVLVESSTDSLSGIDGAPTGRRLLFRGSAGKTNCPCHWFRCSFKADHQRVVL
jgi:3-hydroxyisobutyrate dehydrogenase-like beta-hydroxyacid dehydrogenase